MRRSSCLCRPVAGPDRSDRREVDCERGSPANLALHVDCAIMGADDAMDHRKTHSRAVARLLGGEERLEDPALVSLGHAVSGIADLDSRIAPRQQTGAAAAKRFRQIHPRYAYL